MNVSLPSQHSEAEQRSGRLQGKVALITGGGKGIGKAAALQFASEGAHVLIAELDHIAGASTEHEILRLNGKAKFVACDATNEENVQAAIEAAVKTWGRLDILYNNAGGSIPANGSVIDASTDNFWKTIKLNLFSTWVACRHGIPELIRGGGGSVINTSSVTGIIGLRGMDSYTAAKGGIIALTRSMAVEFAAHHVRVNAIAPTTIQTERTMAARANMPDPGNWGGNRNLLGPGVPNDVANAALYLASDESRLITGHILTVDSGLTMS